MDNINACEGEFWETTDSEDDVSDGKLHMEGEAEGLSDIDDEEVGSYLTNEKEMNYKKMIWELMNQKYVKEQEAKRHSGSAKVTSSKRKAGHKRAADLEKAQPDARTTCPTSPKKRPNSRINYDALSNNLDEPLPLSNPKKRRSESDSNKNISKSYGETSTNIDAGDATDKSEDEENVWREDQNYSHYSNQEEYYYDDDDEFF